jgi:hypothetical protein
MRLITVFAGASAPPHHHTAKTRLSLRSRAISRLFYDGKWHLSQQETIFRLPNNIDTFRNARSTRARLLMFLMLGGFENFLEQIGPFSPATDMARMIEITARYGITLHLWVAPQRSGFSQLFPKTGDNGSTTHRPR